MYFSYRQLKDLAAQRADCANDACRSAQLWPARCGMRSGRSTRIKRSLNIDTMEHIVARAVARQRFSMLLLGHLRRAGAAPCRGRHLRRHELLGGATHARDRHPDGARRAKAGRAGNDSAAGPAAGRDRRGTWDRRSAGPHSADVQPALRGERDRSDNFRRDHSRAHGCSSCCELHSRASRDAESIRCSR